MHELALLLSLNLTLLNGTSICMSYQWRNGSLLATDLTLSFLRLIYSRGICYEGKELLPVEEPLKIIANFTEYEINGSKAEIKIEKYVIQWYQLMLSTSKYSKLSKELVECIEDQSPVSDVCLLALQGLYYKAYSKPLVVKYLDGCVARNIDYLNTSIPKDVVLWTLSHYRLRRIEFRNETIVPLAIDFLRSLYAYLIYYYPKEAKLVKELYASAIGSTCSWNQTVSIILSLLTYKEKWWLYYPKLVIALSSLPVSS